MLLWKVCPIKGTKSKLLGIVQNVCYFNTGLVIWKWHKFGIKDCYPKRRLMSHITKYRLLMSIWRLRNRDKNRGEVKNVSTYRTPGRPSCFSDLPEKSCDSLIQGNLTGLCFSGRSEKKRMAALSSDWLRQFRLFLWNRWTEFNKTWQEARSQCFLPSLCFWGRWVNKNFRPGRSVKKVAHCNQGHDMWHFALLFPIKYWQHNAFCDFCRHMYSSRPLMPYTFLPYTYMVSGLVCIHLMQF